jgi:hypothetical protein
MNLIGLNKGKIFLNGDGVYIEISKVLRMLFAAVTHSADGLSLITEIINAT